MKKDIEQITSEMALSMMDLIRIPQERQNEIITRELSLGIAETIIDNFETLPSEYTYRTEEITGEKIYRLKFNVISTNELDRLRLIEKQYIDECRIKSV